MMMPLLQSETATDCLFSEQARAIRCGGLDTRRKEIGILIGKR